MAVSCSRNLGNNVNGDIALVNGSPLVTHSLTFDTGETYQNILNYIEENQLPFGSEITIEPPTAVNVIISESLDAGKKISKKRARQLGKLRSLSRQYHGIDPRNHNIALLITLSM